MIGVNVKGATSARRALEKLINSTREGIKREVRRACIATASKAKQFAPQVKPSGGLRDQIGYQIDPSGTSGSVFSSAPYAPFVEGIYHNYVMGRGPGRWPPGGEGAEKRPILEWLLLKGLVQPDTVANRNSMEFLVRRKIGLRGTKATPHLKPAYDFESITFDNNMKRILRQAAEEAARVGGTVA